MSCLESAISNCLLALHFLSYYIGWRGFCLHLWINANQLVCSVNAWNTMAHLLLNKQALSRKTLRKTFRTLWSHAGCTVTVVAFRYTASLEYSSVQIEWKILWAAVTLLLQVDIGFVTEVTNYGQCELDRPCGMQWKLKKEENMQKVLHFWTLAGKVLKDLVHNEGKRSSETKETQQPSAFCWLRGYRLSYIEQGETR